MTVSNKPGHRGEREVSRKTIARGMPGDFRCDRGDYTRVLSTLHTRLRAHRAPGIPCALCNRRTGNSGKTRAKGAARSRNCALNQATQKHSSCPGLTRASIDFARAFSKQMDCRVKPGNDILMALRATRGEIAKLCLGT